MELERLSYLGPFRISCFDVIIEGKQCKLTTGIVIDRYKFLAFINNLASFFFLRWFFQFVCVGYYFSIKINKKMRKK